jgi:integrase
VVYRRGRFWYYEFQIAGRRVRESSRSTSRTVAVYAERQRRRELEESLNRIERRKIPPTFEVAARQWLESREGKVAPTTMTIGRVAVKHLVPIFGRMVLSDISPRDLEMYQRHRLKQGAQGRTINIEVQALRQILKYHQCWYGLEGKVRPLRERKSVGRALFPHEEARLLAECAKSDSACYTAVVLALNTAMRKGEIRLLRWGQINFLNRTLTVGKSKTAAGEGRLIPLNHAAITALANWSERFPGHKPEAFIFPRAEGGTTPDLTLPTKGWRTAWRNACRRAGLKVRFHDLRHTAITKLAESQASDQTIMAIAGHISRDMLERYSHIRLEAKRAALDSIATRLPDDTACGKLPIFEGDPPQNPPHCDGPQKDDVRKLLN